MHSKNMTSVLIAGWMALLCALPAAAANLAGSAVFVSGKVTATTPAGEMRQLNSRDKVYSGDMLETAKGRVQIKFLDGAFMSIQPHSKFQIEDYNYANKSDGSEKGVYNLFKGGMRAFSGAIGKKHPDAYKVKTPVATIGIRGTGHNTRICSGDCVGTDGLPLPDGLYHSTWEGTTFVTNDFGTSTVPFGSAVFVAGIDAEPEETTETSEVTGVQPSDEGADELEEQQEQQEEQVTLESGEQVETDGNPVGFIADPVTVFAGLNHVSVAPPQPESEDSVDIALITNPFQAIEFFTPAGPVGTYGTDVNDGAPGTEYLATIDPLGILASSNPASAAAKALISAAMADPANDAVFDAFFDDPANIAEFTVDSDIGFGRWASGSVLLFDDEGGVFLKTLEDDQSLHFIFGNSPAATAAGATGVYDFIGGTQSTGSIGDGVQNGSLTFDFDDMSGTIAMTVSHGLLYTIEGDLLIDVVFPALFSDDGTLVATTTSGNCSEGGCEAFIEGSFFGPLAANGGGPVGAGLEYDINEDGEVIKGVAAFTNVTEPPPPPPPAPLLTLVQTQSLLGVLTDQMRDPDNSDNADGGNVTAVTVLTGDDSDGTNGMVAAFGTEVDGNKGDGGMDETLDLLITIDPVGVEDFATPDSNITKAQALIAFARDGGANEALVDSVTNDPAKVAEHMEGSFLTTDYAFGRWHDGKVLFIDEVLDGPNIGDKTVEVDDLGVDNYLHYLYGDAPDTDFGTGATGTYALVPTKRGTASTDTHNGFVGMGVQSGSLTFDFDTLNGRVVDMVVLHDDTYTVNGYLEIDPTTPGQFSDVESRVSAATTGIGSTCEDGCDTFIEGTFFGALAGAGINGAPEVAGLEYEILTAPFDGESGNSIIGNAVFGRTGTADPLPLSVITNQIVVGVAPDPMGDVDAFVFDDVTVILGDDSMGTPGPLAGIGTAFEDAPVMGDPEIPFFEVVTIDPIGIFALDVNPGSDEHRAILLINDAIGTNSADVMAVDNNPAKLAEYFQGDGFAFGRWADGKVLLVAQNENNGDKAVFVETLTGGLTGQSRHFASIGTLGPFPGVGTGATGTYDFVGGTDATSKSGIGTGDGIINGQILVEFDVPTALQLTMTVNFDSVNYAVGGTLALNPLKPGQFSNTAVAAFGGTCGGGCNTFIDGHFGGDLVGGAEASPEFAALEYDINAPSDIITGVGVFERTGDVVPPLLDL